MRPEPHLAAPDAGNLAALRTALTRAGYDQRRIETALGPRPRIAWTRREVYQRRLSEAGDLGTLIRLFRLRDAVAVPEAQAALAPADLDALVAAGLLKRDDDAVTAPVELSPYSGLLIANDRVEPSGAMEPWHVLFGAASRTLAALTIRTPISRALDLGSGCGVQALLAARHAEHVIATDLGERALTFTRINAALNGVSNVETRRGDLFEPVEGERFGLIVSNPPFVVSPATELLFRDSGLPRDEISRRVVHGAGERLEEGGHAVILCSWIRPTEGHWSLPLRGWPPPSCDAVFLQFTSAKPLEYAEMWTDELDRWLEYYREQGIEWISTGAAVLRRRHGGRMLAFQANAAPGEGAGDQLARVLDAFEPQDRDDAWYLQGRFRLVDHRLDQAIEWKGGAYEVSLTGVAARGAPLNARVETEAINVVALLDGSTTLADAVDQAADDTGLDAAQIQAAAVATARRLYERGFLVLES